ncbi:MAG TPA: nuclear transport factor 2 family protein [Pyrinomonadaceae bacterium]|nr:nuclear transport factor 2 family protein [Pyrinomonadaceae bacterium]
MKRTSLIWAMLLALVFSALVVGQETTKSKGAQAGGVEQQLKQMEDDWQIATRTKDAAKLRRIIAEDWVATDDQGKALNREQYISQTTTNPDVIQSNENFDMQVRVYGDTAVVTGGLTERGTRNGTAYLDTYRWTDVFVKRGGHWQAVVSQWAKIPNPS